MCIISEKLTLQQGNDSWASMVTISQGRPYSMADSVFFRQFTGQKVDFTIQWLILWPHSKWRNKCYYDDYVVLDSYNHMN